MTLGLTNSYTIGVGVAVIVASKVLPVAIKKVVVCLSRKRPSGDLNIDQMCKDSEKRLELCNLLRTAEKQVEVLKGVNNDHRIQIQKLNQEIQKNTTLIGNLNCLAV